MRKLQSLLAAALVTALPAVVSGARAEVIEEIVAKVNDDVITKSDLEQEEQQTVSELYRQFSGSELDEKVRMSRTLLLQGMIDRKILFHRAQRLYDMDKMSDAFFKSFKQQQQIKTDQELEKLLAREGMTVSELKRRLVESFAPDEVIRYEVSDRISIGDKDIDAYYAAHGEEFDVPGVVTIREIVVLASAENREAKRADAARVRERAAQAGADFGTIAGEVSEAGTRGAGGLLGPLKQGDLSAQIEQVAFSIPIGEVSPVIETAYGFHILKVETRTDARRKPLEEVRVDIRKKLEEKRYQDELRAFLKQARTEATVEISPAYKNRLVPAPETSPAGNP